MGFYLRKSVSVGPFRFNLSRSGIGVSTGIKGFRVGTGPRGNYVQMGRGGLYFRTTLPSESQGVRNPPPTVQPPVDAPDGLEEIESGSTLGMVDSSSVALLAEINSKATRMRLWPFAVIASVVLLGSLAALRSPAWVFCVVFPLCCGSVYAASLRDRLKKTVVLFYEMEPQFEEAYQRLHNAFEQMRTCHKRWHVEAKGDVGRLHEWKTNAGADALVRRKPVTFGQGTPPYFKTNVAVPTIPAGRQTLYLFPDRLLVYAPEGVGAVSYDSLNVTTGDERFIETTGVPGDAQVVGQTWRYVNKSGGPDRRYRDNSEIPIAIYAGFQIVSRSGLRESFQLSKAGTGSAFKNAVSNLAAVLGQRAAVAAEAFATCPCNNCSGHIEFPLGGMGQTIVCPHCGLETLLFKPAVK